VPELLDELVHRVLPVLVFLVAITVVAELSEIAGVFEVASSTAARWARGRVWLLWVLVVALATASTIVLSLDTTAVLLTPVVLTLARRLGVSTAAFAMTTVWLANTASMLLPVSNLTNLLAFAATGLSFAGFAAVMALPWLVVIGVEYAVFRWAFAEDLNAPAGPATATRVGGTPWFALAVLAATLVGFGLSEPVGVAPVWIAAAGATVLAGRRLRGRLAAGAGGLVRAANIPFCGFVFSLGVVVLAVRAGPVGDAVRALVPDRADFAGLLTAAVLAAVLANLVNNLPATLMVVPLVAGSPGLVLAVLLGVNLGPNLTYVGSLATLLWRQILHARDHPPAVREFLRLGVLTVPACLVTGVAALWAGLRLWGPS
jgi:arsenical pump membrane protein